MCLFYEKYFFMLSFIFMKKDFPHEFSTETMNEQQAVLSNLWNWKPHVIEMFVYRLFWGNEMYWKDRFYEKKLWHPFLWNGILQQVWWYYFKLYDLLEKRANNSYRLLNSAFNSDVIAMIEESDKEYQFDDYIRLSYKNSQCTKCGFRRANKRASMRWLLQVICAKHRTHTILKSCNELIVYHYGNELFVYIVQYENFSIKWWFELSGIGCFSDHKEMHNPR